MKRSFPALIFGLLCLGYLPLLGGFSGLVGRPQLMDPNTAGYTLLMDLPYYLMRFGSISVMLIGSPFAIIGYTKTRPSLILRALIILSFAAVTYFGYPIYLILPISVGILGYVAYKDTVRLSVSNKENVNSIQ